MTATRTVRILEDITYDSLADYGGSDRKNGIIIDGARYMVKFQERETKRNANQTSNVNNVIAEYLSSHIAHVLGLPVHETMIVSINNELAVACKNFEGQSERHIDFDRFMHRHYDSKDVGRHPTLSQIQEVLETDWQLAPAFDENVNSFWDMFVFDAIVGNYDRHGGNWGYLARANSNVARQSPLYDNASTFYPTLSEYAMPDILGDAKEVAKRVLLFPNSAIEHKGHHRLSYYDVLMSGFAGIPAALGRMAASIDSQRILSIIDETPMSDVRRTFYKTMILARLELLIYPAIEQAHTGSFDTDCAHRLEEGRQMTLGDFEDIWQESMGHDNALYTFYKKYRAHS